MHTDTRTLGEQVDAAFARMARARREALDRAVREIEGRFAADRDTWLAQTVDGHARRSERTLLPLNWQFDEATGTVTGQSAAADYPDEQAVQVATEWARAFDLTPNPRAVTGTVEWMGTIDGLDVRVWAISDRDAFYGPIRTGEGR